jgi:phospholipid N-methyltransferase
MAAPVPPDLGAELGVIGERTNWVLANLPPAAVWRYRRISLVPVLARAA